MISEIIKLAHLIIVYFVGKIKSYYKQILFTHSIIHYSSQKPYFLD